MKKPKAPKIKNSQKLKSNSKSLKRPEKWELPKE